MGGPGELRFRSVAHSYTISVLLPPLQPVLGIHFTPDSVSCARVSGNAKKGTIVKKAQVSLPQGALRDGAIQKPEQIIQALVQLKKTCGNGTAVVCIPPEKVYASLLEVAPSQGSKLTDLLETAIAETIPEERADLTYQHAVLDRSKTAVRVSVVAARKDILQGYLDVCAKAGFSVAAVTSAPLALGSTRTEGSVLVVMHVPGSPPTLTCLLRGLPVDEEVLPEGTSDAACAEAASAFAQECEATTGPSKMVVLGKDSLISSLQHASDGSAAVLPAVGWLNEHDWLFAGAVAAALAQPGALSAVFGRKARKATRLPLLLLILLFAAGIVALMYNPSLLKRMQQGTGDYTEALSWAVENTLFTDAATTPDAVVTRAEFVKLIVDETAKDEVRSIREPSGFADVAEGDWYFSYARYAKKFGIAGGEAFRPNDPVTFAAALKMVYTAFRAEVPPSDGMWYEPYLRQAQQQGMLLDPAVNMENPVTKKDAIWMVWTMKRSAR